MSAGKKLKRRDFVYDAEADCYRCPGGAVLHFVSERQQKGRRQRVYRSLACGECSLQRLCFENQRGLRQIYRDASEALAEQMAQRLEKASSKARLRRRRESVEPVFGNLKWNLGFRRFRLRGLSQVQGEFALLCMGHNVNKLFGLLRGVFVGLWLRVIAVWLRVIAVWLRVIAVWLRARTPLGGAQRTKQRPWIQHRLLTACTGLRIMNLQQPASRD